MTPSNHREIAGRLYELHGEKLRFLIVGVWNTVFNIAVYNLLLTLMAPLAKSNAGTAGLLGLLARNEYIVAFWLAWIVSVVQSTATMKYFVFRSAGRLWQQVRRAYLVYLPAQGLSTVVLWATVQVFSLSPRIGQLIAIGISTIFSYFGHKYFTFRPSGEATEERDRA